MGIKKRLYEDFFRPEQFDSYDRVLRAAKEAGYEFHTVESFEKAAGGGQDFNTKTGRGYEGYEVYACIACTGKKIWCTFELLFPLEHFGCESYEGDCRGRL